MEIAMRYLVKLKLIPMVEDESKIRGFLKKHGIPFTLQKSVWELSFEKRDARLAVVQEALASMGYKAPPFYEPLFAESEVEKSEILHLFVRALCGRSFAEWASILSFPLETRVMDKREMRNQDIALTFGFEVVISNRLREILSREGLTGWDAKPVSHKDPAADRYPALFHLVATNELPALAPITDLLRVQRKGVATDQNRSSNSSELNSGFEALFQVGPLYYQRQDLQRIDDFNRTRELFGEPEQAQALLLISQRGWQLLRKHKIKNVDVEPVIILD